MHFFNYNVEDAKVPEIQEKIKPITIYMMTKDMEYLLNILYEIYQTYHIRMSWTFPGMENVASILKLLSHEHHKLLIVMAWTWYCLVI